MLCKKHSSAESREQMRMEINMDGAKLKQYFLKIKFFFTETEKSLKEL